MLISIAWGITKKIVFKDFIARSWTLMKVLNMESFICVDEVPIILHELNDSAIHFISRD